MEDQQSLLFKENKVFFAFNNEQFKKSMIEHNISKTTKIVSMGQGMYCPRINAKRVMIKLDKIYKKSIVEDMKQGKNKVILREIENHECFYTGDLTDCFEKLQDYPITKEEIREVYWNNYKNYNNYE